ncbi:hypothetical protein EMIT0P43_20106 [Pseudomonas jessenii]
MLIAVCFRTSGCVRCAGPFLSRRSGGRRRSGLNCGLSFDLSGVVAAFEPTCLLLAVYISVAAVTAAYGFALTAPR